MKILENRTFDEERALYGSQGVTLKNCRFDGPADGESALKESADVRAENCFFNLRYPFWHDRGLKICHSELTPLCRAALWYSENVEIEGTKLFGIKALRECGDVTLSSCEIVSPEFGWSVRGLTMRRCTAESEYFLMRSESLRIFGLQMKGKYSFQYVRGAELSGCVLDTKDAFWHAKNVVVRDSVVKGEYLGWYSEGLTFINCKIIGTQPLCYCKSLRLIDCEMEGTDLSFEKSEVEATIRTPVLSVKNPLSGVIRLPAVGEVILDDPRAKGEVIVELDGIKRE